MGMKNSDTDNTHGNEPTRLRSIDSRCIEEAAPGDLSFAVTRDCTRMAGDDQVLRLPEVCRMTALSRSTVYKLIQEGDFPPPIKLTVRSSGWRLSEIQGWLQTRPDYTGSVHAGGRRR